jgi:hypothetical protein
LKQIIDLFDQNIRNLENKTKPIKSNSIKIRNYGMMSKKSILENKKETFFPIESIENTRIKINKFLFNLFSDEKDCFISKLEIENSKFGNYIIDDKRLNNFISAIGKIKLFDCSKNNKESILFTFNDPNSKILFIKEQKFNKEKKLEIITKINIESYEISSFENINENKLVKSIIDFFSTLKLPTNNNEEKAIKTTQLTISKLIFRIIEDQTNENMIVLKF